ncbi:hypothetical protein [Roseospirillum parvum]|uniref:Uncharacterized protein n=1 Tax=Roseospirillum parvum TaxID=83401 RepID=A0A1G7ZJ77_9PROT|nr:hypothetical protein [Roseospirillum parvum]SDH08724.1 hypothetical protein SAMN05421742_104125 [Roseospirillum parvum]
MPPRIPADVALTAAIRQLEQAVAEQERAANRILGLAELLVERQPGEAERLRVEGIMEACGFQDITGQRLRKVGNLLKHLARELDVTIPPPPADADGASGKPRPGLSQQEVDRLLRRRP